MIHFNGLWCAKRASDIMTKGNHMTDLDDVIREYADDLAELQHKIEILQEENARLKAELAAYQRHHEKKWCAEDLAAPRTEVAMVEMALSTICPLLHGLPPDVQSMVLADLFAMWLAGHQGEKPWIEGVRENLIRHWCELVRDLIPINERMIAERIAEGATKQ